MKQTSLKDKTPDQKGLGIEYTATVNEALVAGILNGMHLATQECKVVSKRKKPDLLNTVFKYINSAKLHSSGKGYVFTVTDSKQINFNKINDDLTYANPLAIIRTPTELGNQIWAVVHHSISNKFMRSVNASKLSEDTKEFNLPPAIFESPILIKNNEISSIVSAINWIKSSKWQQSRIERTKHTGIPVIVEYIQIK